MKSKDSLDEPINWNHAVYALGKLTDVIVILVEGEGDVRSRLHKASPRLIRAASIRSYRKMENLSSP